MTAAPGLAANFAIAMNDMSALVRPRHGMGFYPFVGLTAALMATNALAIDSMLPALPQMAEALGIAEANQRQWIITAYLLGFGVSQIFYGTISDRFGRRPVLLVGLSIYVIASIAAAFSGSFEAMMAARTSAPYVEINAADAKKLKIADGDLVEVSVGASTVQARAHVNGAAPAGTVLLPRHLADAAAPLAPAPGEVRKV